MLTANEETATNDIDIPTIVAWWKRVSHDERTQLWVSLFEDDDWNTYIDECVKLALSDPEQLNDLGLIKTRQK
jgi:hypothetical protein